MKSLSLFAFIYCITIIPLMGQKSFTEKVNGLKINSTLKTKAITAFNATKDPCWEGTGDVTKDCSDLKDPWDKEPKLPQQPPADTSARITAFYNFESEIARGVGGKEFPGILINQAWSMHPGFSLAAMRARMAYYSLKIDK